jgi:hypothetical protein
MDSLLALHKVYMNITYTENFTTYKNYYKIIIIRGKYLKKKFNTLMKIPSFVFNLMNSRQYMRRPQQLK